MLKLQSLQAYFLDVEMNDIVDAVENYQPANNRSQVKDYQV